MLRAYPVTLLLGLGAGLLTGCGGAHSGGFEREVVVAYNLPAGDFNPPAAAVATLRKNCPGGPQAVPEPLPPADAPASTRLFGVRYNVAGADDRTIADLETCLQAQPDVKYAQLEDEDS